MDVSACITNGVTLHWKKGVYKKKVGLLICSLSYIAAAKVTFRNITQHEALLKLLSRELP
jgi:hypothetical protein